MIILIYPPLSYKKLTNTNPLPENIVKGVFHVHSDYSDGRGDINEITKAGEHNGLDFIILTDHGEPNLKCADSTSFMNNVLLIGGSEFSLDCGHLASAGFKVEKYKIPFEPMEAIGDVNKNGGFTFVAHPFDNKIPWTDWDIKDFTGIEILSSYSSARRKGILNLLAFPLRYAISQDYSLLNSLDYPVANLKAWDSLNKKGQYMGIYALDAHAKIPLTKKISLDFPSYKSIFGILNIYVKIDKPLDSDPARSAEEIIAQIKNGKYYNVIEGIAPANGFDIKFNSINGKSYEAGDSIPLKMGSFKIDLPFDFPVNVKIIRNGKNFFYKKNVSSKNVKIGITDHGVYRCEIYAGKSKFKDLIWIMTNPFFIKTDKQSESNNIELNAFNLFSEKEPFKVEKNKHSSGIIEYDYSDTNEIVTKLNYVLKGNLNEKNFWVSLSSRKKRDLSKYSGIIFESKSSESMRYWIEIRTGNNKEELWFRHSFHSSSEWSKIRIPFDKMHMISKKSKNKKMNLSKTESVFISINNSIVNYPKIKADLEIRNFSVYK